MGEKVWKDCRKWNIKFVMSIVSKKQKRELEDLLYKSLIRKIMVLGLFLVAALIFISATFAGSVDFLYEKYENSKLLINDGEEYTGSVLVELSIPDKGTSFITLSNTINDFDKPVLKYASEYYFELEGGDGVKSVFVNYYDEEDDWQNVVEAEIVLDRQVPEIPVIMKPQKNLMVPASLLFFQGTTDPGVEVFIEIDDRSFRMVSLDDGYWGGELPVRLVKEKEYHFCVWVRDFSGNESGDNCRSFYIIK